MIILYARVCFGPGLAFSAAFVLLQDADFQLLHRSYRLQSGLHAFTVSPHLLSFNHYFSTAFHLFSFMSAALNSQAINLPTQPGLHPVSGTRYSSYRHATAVIKSLISFFVLQNGKSLFGTGETDTSGIFLSHLTVLRIPSDKSVHTERERKKHTQIQSILYFLLFFSISATS